MPSSLFTGPSSLRDPGERLAFWLTLLFAFPAAGFLGIFIHESVGVSEVALFIVFAMIYVTLARGRLLGSSVRIHESQNPRVFAIVKRTCAALEIPMPFIFVREDNFVPAAALGFGEPYSLVLSSRWIDHFEDDELAFVIGREMGHIAAGHTRYLSLISINGNENPIIALIFGAWLRRCDLTCDKIGLLVCGSLSAATRAIAVITFHSFGRKVDMDQFAEQAAELKNDAVLRLGEWLGAQPYATKRISSMRRFIASHAFTVAEEWFLREVAAEPPALPRPGSTKVLPADCAGHWRRLTAFTIDAVLVLAIIGAIHDPQISVSNSDRADTTPTASASVANTAAKRSPRIQIGGVESPALAMNKPSYANVRSTLEAEARASRTVLFTCLLAFYLWLLVGLAGQTFGMMITGLRVVDIDYQRVGIGRALLRYGFVVFFWWLIIPFGFFSRILLHDKISNTRLVTSERVMARVVSSAPQG